MPFQSQSENSCDSVVPTPSPCPPPGSDPSTSEQPTTSKSSTTPTATSSFETSNGPRSYPTFLRIAIHLIDLDHARNGRLETDPDAIRRLRDQIATSGLINPITIRPTGDRFQLIAGLNRLEAFRLLQRTEIPAHVVTPDDTGASTMRLTENLTRSNLSPVEEAAQLGDLVGATAGGVDVVASTIGRSVNWVLDRLEILDWDTDLQQAVHAKKISAAAAKRLARIADPETRRNYVRQAAVHGISARTAALWLQDSISLAQPPSDLSENVIPNSQPTTPPITLIDCYFCGTKHNITDTYPVRLCPVCLATIQRATRDGTQQENRTETTVTPSDVPTPEIV